MEALTIPRTIRDVFEQLPTGTLAQFINGQIIMSPAPTEGHQRMVGFLFGEIYIFLKKEKTGKVYVSPIDVELNYSNIYQPDIIYISNANSGIIHNKRIYGAPDLVIEILSAGTEQYDKKDKLKVYEESGVKEYVLVDASPDVPTATGYLLNANDEFETIYRDETAITLYTLNLKLNLADY